MTRKSGQEDTFVRSWQPDTEACLQRVIADGAAGRWATASLPMGRREVRRYLRRALIKMYDASSDVECTVSKEAVAFYRNTGEGRQLQHLVWYRNGSIWHYDADADRIMSTHRDTGAKNVLAVIHACVANRQNEKFNPFMVTRVFHED